MIGGIDPKKMQAMMKQMGIKQEAVAAKRVIIEQEEGRIVIDNPNVTKVIMQGQETWQVIGDASEEAYEGISEADVALVAEKTGKSKEEARKALMESSDIAEAIIKLSE